MALQPQETCAHAHLHTFKDLVRTCLSCGAMLPPVLPPVPIMEALRDILPTVLQALKSPMWAAEVWQETSPLLSGGTGEERPPLPPPGTQLTFWER